MATTIELVATSTGSHYLSFGMNANELSAFAIQLYITKYGKRAIDWMQSLSLGFCSWMAGEIWLHNSDDVDRCTFFDEKKDFKIGIVANQNPLTIKVLDALEIDSEFELPRDRKSTWEVESVTIPATVNYPDGMYSKIPSGKFEEREGMLNAEFLRNMRSTEGSETGTYSALDALRGEPLRGNEALLVLKNTSTGKVKLFKVVINMTSSKI